MPIFIFAAPAESQSPQDPAASTQEDLRQSIDNLTKVTADLTQVVNALAENSQSARNPNGTENWLRIVVPIILAIIGAVAWLNRKLKGFEKDIQRIDESVKGLKTDLQNLEGKLGVDLQNLRAEFKAEIQNLREEVKTEIQNLREELKTDGQNLEKELKIEIQNLKTDVQNLEKELKIEIQNLKEIVHELDKGLQIVVVQSKNTDKWVEEIRMDIREIRSEIRLLRGQKPDDMPKIEGEN